jgi:transcriptional regulator with XRE-family HTH domain
LGDKYVENPVTLGDRIRNRRLELGLLQKNVARMIGVSEDTITFWECNRFDPSEKYMRKIRLFLFSD